MKLIESIRVEQGVCQLLDYHEERVAKSLAYLGCLKHMSIADYTQSILSNQSLSRDTLYKLRFEYDINGFYSPSLSPYQPKEIKKIYLTEIDDIHCYEYKWADRSALFSPKVTEHSEVIFIHKGLLTDTSYSNIVLEYSDGKMLSPRVPLLRGLMRNYLLENSQIQLADLSVEDIMNCSRIHLINAMLPLGYLSVNPSIIEL